MTNMTSSEKRKKEQAFSTINTRAFLSVVAILVTILILSGALSYIVPQGSYERDEQGVIVLDTYVGGQVSGIPFWKVITAPVRVFASSDAITIIAISVFLLIMSGVFNLLDKTDGIRVFIWKTVQKFSTRKNVVLCVATLIFMAFGSVFGMFEELVTLLPLVVICKIGRAHV